MPLLQKWGLNFVDSEKEFRHIDMRNKGFVLFNDFADYCILKSISGMK
jgi:hypothetical protein